MRFDHSDSETCPLCEYSSVSLRAYDHGDKCKVQCPRCGNFSASSLGISEARNSGIQHFISAWLRDRHERSLESPEVTRDWVRTIAKVLPRYGVLDKQLLLLRYLAEKSPFPGASVEFESRRDAPVAWAKQPEEASYLLRSLKERGLISRIETLQGPIIVTTDGWQYLDEHQGGQQTGHQGFVAMSFKTEMDGARDTIFQALRGAGYSPYRTDAAPHIDRIDSKIIAEIRNSRFLVADVTHQSQGVYFEAGFAMALGLPVFWLVKDDDKANLHFDTRQFNHIVWRDEAHLEDQLRDFVVAILGRGPLPAD
jgi:nucleoside 2-deoxyribosyltransferase